TTTRPSRRISSRRASLTAWMMLYTGIDRSAPRLLLDSWPGQRARKGVCNGSAGAKSRDTADAPRRARGRKHRGQLAFPRRRDGAREVRYNTVVAASARITKGWEKTGVSSLPRASQPVDMSGRLVGSYRLSRLIGQGGMGAVYEAAHQQLQRRVAVKILNPEF